MSVTRYLRPVSDPADQFIEKTLMVSGKSPRGKVTLARQLAERLEAQGNTNASKKYRENADKVDDEVGLTLERFD